MAKLSNADIRALAKAGKSPREISKMIGIDRRTVSNIVANGKVRDV